MPFTNVTGKQVKVGTNKIKQDLKGSRYGNPSIQVGYGRREPQETPPLDQAQTFQQMPNYDRLLPGERWLTDKLPGFAETSVGKALAGFEKNHPTASKLLGYFDAGIEGIERTSGFVQQAREAMKNGTVDDFKDNIREAWYAGSLAADVYTPPEQFPIIDLPSTQGIKDTPEYKRHVYTQEGLPGVAGMVAARKRIANYVDSGMDYREALVQAKDEYYQDLGALALRSQIQDAYVHILFDPTNWIMPMLRPVERITALRNMGLATKYSDDALDAMRTAQKTAEEAGNVEEAARLGTALKDAKGLTRGERMAIAITGGDPLKPGKLATKWNPAALTPSSRAHELLTMVTDHVGAYILSKTDDPHEMVGAINRAFKGGMGNEYGHAFMNIEGRTAQAALAGFDAQATDLLRAYDMVADERNALQRIAAAAGTTPYEVMDVIHKGDPAALGGLARRVGSTPDELGRIGALLKDVPYTPELFKHVLSNKVIDQAAEFGVTLFGVKSRGFLEKLSNAMKAGESLAFLRLNPAYPLKNMINNEMTILGRGLNGVSVDDITDLVNKIGFEPPRMAQGFGMEGLTSMIPTKAGVPGTAIAKALRGEGGKLEDFADAVRKINLGKLDTSVWARRSEEAASKRAFTAGYMQGWRRYYWKPNKGFDSLGATLSPAARDAVNQLDPALLKHFDNAIASAYREGDIDAFTRGNLNLNIKSVMDDASKRAGFDIEAALPEEFIAKHEAGLIDAAKSGKVREYMGTVRTDLQKNMDELNENALELAATQTKARIAAEGPKGLLKVYGDAMDEFWGGHQSHAIQMEKLGDEIRSTTDSALVDAMWRKIKDSNEKHFARYWDRLEGTVKGIKQGAKHAGFEFPEEVYDTVGKWKKGWRDFFSYRNTEQQKIIDLRNAGKPTEGLWDNLAIELDNRYKGLVEIEDGYLTRMDNLVANMLPDENLKPSFLAWRRQAADLRLADKEGVIAFRESIKGLSPEARNAAYTEFWKQRYANWTQQLRNEQMGIQMMQGNPQAQQAFDAMAQTMPPPAVVEAVQAAPEAGKATAIVDDGGKPLAVYHGTNVQFDTFEKTKDIGFHFGTKKAAQRRVSQLSKELKVPKTEYTVGQYYLDIKNPLELPDYGNWRPIDMIPRLQKEGVLPKDLDWLAKKDELRKVAVSRFGKEVTPENIDDYQNVLDKLTRDYLVEQLETAGYDGIVYRNVHEGDTSYIALRSEQILKQPPITQKIAVTTSDADKFKNIEGIGGVWGRKHLLDNGFSDVEIDDLLARGLLRESEYAGEPTLRLADDFAKDIQRARQAAPEAAKAVPVEKQFIPDLDQFVKPQEPVAVAADQFWHERGFDGLDALEEAAFAQSKKKPLLWDNLPDNVKAELERHIAKVKGQMSDARYASIRFGEFRRDAALLNYNRRYNYNTWLGIMMPFEFWTTQSLAKWALHSIDRPAMLNAYMHIKRMLETTGAPNQALPSRLKGTVRVPLPFLPDWMGNALFVDPLRAALPFDNFMYPYEQYKQLMTTREGRTIRLLQDKVGTGEITPQEAQDAINAKSGDIWEQATAEMTENDSSMRYDAFDFAQAFSSPHAPLMWAAEVAKGTPEDIGPLMPLSRTMKGAAGLLGVDWNNSPLNMEAKVRKMLGLPVFDKWDDYRIDRMLSNMTARNEITAEEAKRAMIDRSGAAYDEAVKKANFEFGVGAAGSTLGIPTRAYPEGEFLQRSLADDFSKAYERYESGDVEALTKFFDKHPEYEARLALFKNPEERLQQFLIDELWNTYNGLGSLNKKEARDQMGSLFNDAFLNKETRSYESIPTETMQAWLRMMGGDPPGTLTGYVPDLKLAPADVAQNAQVFYDYRNQNFPNFYEEQRTYFDLKKGDARRNFLKDHPNLVRYWDWRRDFFTRNPDVVPYLDDNFEFNYESEAERTAAFESQPNFTPQEWQSQLGVNLYNLVDDYAYEGRDLSSSARTQLEQIAAQMGYDPDELLEIIADSIRNR